MGSDIGRARVTLGLADEPGTPVAPALWIGGLVGLGSILRRNLPKLEGRQLVLAISVPLRDYVAALIGCGWMLASPPPKLDPPIEVFRAATSGTYLRAVTDNRVYTGAFSWLNEERADPRVLIGNRTLPVDRYKAVAVLDEPSEDLMAELPRPGFLATFTGTASTWLERIAAPCGDLALVGTARWLYEDLTACIGNGADPSDTGNALSDFVLPAGNKAATWATPILPAARLAEVLPISEQYKAVILDGYGAVKYLNDILAPIVVCVVDRSVADESAAEIVMQARSANSQPLSMNHDLGWQLPAGIEAVAFTVAL